MLGKGLFQRSGDEGEIAAVELKNLRRNSALKRFKRRNKAVIVATGPSLKEADLPPSSEFDYFGVSNAYLHQDYLAKRPVMHFFAGYHPPLQRDNFLSWVQAASRVLSDQTAIITDLRDQPMHEDFRTFDHSNVYYLAHGATRSKYRADPTKILPSFWTGPQMIFPVLFYMGYEEIHLYGVDCNTLKDFGGDRSNFYSKEEDQRANATDEKSWPSLETELKAQLKIVECYQRIASFARTQGVRVINKSPESWLDCFDIS